MVKGEIEESFVSASSEIKSDVLDDNVATTDAELASGLNESYSFITGFVCIPISNVRSRLVVLHR